MKEYVLLIMSFSVICGFVKVLMPKTSALGEMSFAMKTVMLCIILSPLFSLTGTVLSEENFLVINEETSHTIDSVEAEEALRIWTAQITSEKLAREIELSIYENFKICVSVEVPWHEENGSVIFEKLKITADCEDKKCDKIEEFVLLHYSLSSECFKGEVNDSKR